MMSAEQQVALPAKRRSRIVKKDVDHIYSASKGQSERFEKVQPDTDALSESAVAFTTTEEPEEPIKKKRGRPSKAELLARKMKEEEMVGDGAVESECFSANVAENLVAETLPATSDETAPGQVQNNDMPDFFGGANQAKRDCWY